MDSSTFFTFSAQKNANLHATRHLPTYEETDVPYSLRLPTYRSSYIRRYHPYARCSASIIEERFMTKDVGDIYDDYEPLLDLSMLYEPIPLMREAPGDLRLARDPDDQVGEQRDEQREAALIIADPGMINGNLGEQGVERGNIERSRQPSPFLRVDMTESTILENI